MRHLVNVSLVLLFLPPTAHSATIHVPADSPTIQAAIDGAASGDTVLVAAGTYTGGGNYNLDFAGSEIVLRSTSGAEQTIVDIQGSSLDNRRGIHFHSGEGVTARVEGFTFRNGFTPQSGTLEKGAGILIELSSPSIVDCVFEDNQAWLGGGIKLSNASPTIDGCVFRQNTASYGGAIDLAGSSPWIEDCDFLGNHALTGGALACRVLDYPTVRECRFWENSASSGGAAVVTWASHPQFERCLFATSSGGDGVVKARQASTLLFRNSTFANNETNGGVLIPRFETGFAPSIRIEHTIIAFNRGPAVHLEADGSEVTLECADLFGNTNGDWIGLIASQANTNGNFSADPLFCDPDTGDFELRASSPCAPPGITACGLVGALPVGCSPISVELSSWARIKARYARSH